MRFGQYVVSWPSLPASACWQPSADRAPALREISKTGLLPPLAPPAVRYRLNVWLVGSAPDAAPMTDLPLGVGKRMTITSPSSVARRISRASAAGEGGDESEPVLYRQYDLPDNPANGQDDNLERVSWDVQTLLPDRQFMCTVEARFETLGAIWWWTPFMCSGGWSVGRVPPPEPPQPLPICNLSTPEAHKLFQQLAIGQHNLVAVRWPWTTIGNPMAALRSANYVLEWSASEDRPSLRDPTAKPRPTEGERTETRTMGPWYEARATQIYFVNFETGEVLLELSDEEAVNPQWTPSLIASGFVARKPGDGGFSPRRFPGSDDPEPQFVRLRWRYRALAEELAVMPTPLHFSAASEPVRTRVVTPTAPPEFRLERAPRARNTTAWLNWTAWEDTHQHQLCFRLLQKRKRKRRGGSSLTSRSNTKTLANVSEEESERDDSKSQGSQSDEEGSRSASKSSRPPSARARPQSGMRRAIDAKKQDDWETGSVSSVGTVGTRIGAGGKDSPFERVTGWIEMPPIRDAIVRTPIANESTDDPMLALEEAAAGVRKPEEELLAEYTRRLPHTDWYRLLFGLFPYKEDRFHDARDIVSDSEMLESGSQSRASSATGSRASRSSAASRAKSATSSMRSGRSGRGGDDGSKKKKTKQRMTFGKVVEWRVRVSDGLRWSLWSPPSEPRGAVAPLPEFTTETRIRFSRHEPTIVQVAWGKCKLPPGFQDIESTIEYVLSVTTEPAVQGTKAQAVLMVGSNEFTEEKLHSRGLHMSDGGCGIVTRFKAEEVVQEMPDFDFEEFFTEGAEVRIVGKYGQSSAKWINWEVDENDHRPEPVIGFACTISGLRPESIHRISVRARCAVAGLDEPDWMRGKVDNVHPIRWSDPNLSSPVLTPLGPPPLLVPQAVPVPEGKFGRFLHTPHLLLKCSIFRRKFRDEFDKDHPIRVDIKEASRVDDEFKEIPLENSVYCFLPEYGFCRFVYNLNFLHVQMRVRNIHMNNFGAPSPKYFTVPPLLLEDQRGPDAELIVADDGNLFVRLQWTVRTLPQQEVSLVQLSLRRHVVESPFVDLQASEAEGDKVLEEILPSAVSAAGEAYEELLGEAGVDPSVDAGERRCPFACRRCYRPLAFEPPDFAQLGPLARSRLRDARTHLQEGCVAFDEVPAYRTWDEDLRGLRVAHHAEVQAREQERHESEPPEMGWPHKHKKGRAEQVCHCMDRVVEKFVPVDGDRVCHGNTYRFRLRVRDAMLWSMWTEFSQPVHISVAAPRPALPLQDPRNPVPPPIVEVIMLQEDGKQLADLSFSEARLRLRWPRFEGRMKEVEYRVLMWTLSPEQQRRATAGRQPGQKPERSLPPLVGTEVFAFNLSTNIRTSAMQVDESGNARFAEEDSNDASAATAKPRVATAGGPASPGETMAKKDVDTPQVIAHLKPDGPVRTNATKLTPKIVVAEGGLQKGQNKAMTLEVNVIPLQKGHAYAFGVEAKHSQGAAGNLGDWSSPLFSKLCMFEAAPSRPLDVTARPALPPSPPLEPPLFGGTGKYLIRQKDRTVYAERLEGPDGDLTMEYLPERRPPGDDLRES